MALLILGVVLLGGIGILLNQALRWIAARLAPWRLA
jgi:sulfonate transport system permease protein